MTTLTKQDEPLFRIGGVYRTAHGWIAMIESAAPSCLMRGRAGECGPEFSGQWLPNGSYWTGPGTTWDMRLIPGELHQVNGEWVPVEEKKEESISRRVDKWMANLADIGAIPAKPAADPNAAMIARDGPAKPSYIETLAAMEREHFGCPDKQTGIYAPRPTAKPALAALTRITAMSHMLGNGIRG